MRKLFIIISLFINCVLSGQDQKLIDSLIQELKTSKEDTNKVKLLNDLAYEYVYFNPSLTLQYSNQAIKLSEKINFDIGYSVGMSNTALALKRTGSINKALAIYKELISFDSKKNQYQRLAIDNNNIATIYNDLGMIDKSILHYFEALKYFEKINDKKGLGSIYVNIGNNYAQRNDASEQAIEFLNKALKNFEEIKDSYRYATALQSLGAIYSDKLGDRKKGLDYFLKAAKVYEELKVDYELANAYVNISSQYSYEYAFEPALKYAYKALNEFKLFEDSLGIANAYTCLGNAYFNYASGLKNEKQHDNYLKPAIQFYDTASLYLTNIDAQNYYHQIFFFKAEAFAGIGKFDSAFVYYKRLASLKDTLYNVEKNRQFEDIRTGYEVEKKEQENISLDQKNKIQALELSKNKYILIGLLIVLILVAFLAVLFIRQNKLKSEQKTIQLEQKLLRSQMNPHFIFNSLNSIHSVVLSGDSKMAAKFLASFSKLIRAILESSRFEEIPLEKEISLLNNYISLQLLRFDDNITFKIEVDPSIDTSTILLPPMLTQPFIENALEHGLSNVENALLLISFKTINGYLIIEVSDNGIGLGHSATNKDHISMATTITKERLTLINRKRKKKAKFSITEAYPTQNENKGVKVIFEIPIDN